VFLPASPQLDGVPGELVDLRFPKLDHFLPGRLEPLPDGLSFRFVRDHLQADQREVRADAHDDVRVINRPAILARAAEGHRFVAKVRAEPLEHFRMGAL
jgi:hypothetical protein